MVFGVAADGWLVRSHYDSRCEIYCRPGVVPVSEPDARVLTGDAVEIAPASQGKLGL